MKRIIFIFFFFIQLAVRSQIQLDSSLFACYPLNGNPGDSSGNGYHGTLYGATPSTDRFNNSNSCYFFDGVNDFIDVGNVLNVPAQTAITVCMWMYPMLINGAINRNVGIHVGEKAKGHLALRMQDESTHYFQALLTSAYSANSRWTRSNQPYTDNNWYFLVGVYTNNYVKLYVNGVQQTTNTGGSGPSNPTLSVVPSTEDLRFAQLPVWNSPAAEHFFHGKLDDIRIYTRELNQTEITYLYQKNVTCATPEPCQLSADFSTQLSICEGDTSSFTDLSIDNLNNIVKWKWDFGDGGSSFSQNPVHYYSSPGQYKVKLIVENSFSQGCLDSVSKTILVYNKPEAKFSYTGACVGDESAFKDLSADSIRPLTKWTWDFGDGSGSSARNPNHLYKNSGSYQVVLIVENGNSNHCSDSDTMTIAIGEAPIAEFTFDEVCVGNEMSFNDNSIYTNNPIVVWNWTFGDVGTSNIQNPSYLFGESGEFEVILNVQNNNNPPCTDADTQLIRVWDYPNVDLGPDQFICVGRNVLLSTEKNQGKYVWNDSTRSNFRMVGNEGTYWVRVSNSCGFATDTVKVKEELCQCKLYYPNSFTPNKDNLNDVFKVETNCTLKYFQISIFNRWGDVIFESEDVKFTWPEGSTDADIMSGFYPFRIKGFFDEQGQLFKIEELGTVQVLR
ncbi:MAG TPA: hypothetical protein DCX54_04920 [Flavobacteriales bacterium]|nr:hypothetical protein [Flavobacteriales bacterium]